MHRSTFKISDNDPTFLIKPLVPRDSTWAYAGTPGSWQLPLPRDVAAVWYSCTCCKQGTTAQNKWRTVVRKEESTERTPITLDASVQEFQDRKWRDGCADPQDKAGSSCSPPQPLSSEQYWDQPPCCPLNAGWFLCPWAQPGLQQLTKTRVVLM